MKRRALLRWALLCFVIVGLMGAVATGSRARAAGAAASGDLNLVQYVNPFNGTDAGQPDYGTGGGAANTFPGATLPFGMVQWSPDTTPSTVNFAGGYSYGDSAIKGFSLTHISGAGCSIYQDIPFMPILGTPATSPVVPFSNTTTYTATFSHADEQATPGYYQVLLNPGTSGAINTQLTATTRTGFGRFTFPATPAATMLINAGGSGNGDSAASVQIDPAHDEVTGSASSGEFCFQRDNYTVYFAAQFSQPFSAYGTWQRQVLFPGGTTASDTVVGPYGTYNGTSNTAQAGAYVSFNTLANQVVLVKVGLSYVSVANAEANLQAENAAPATDASFDAVRQQASDSWNSLLNRVQVSGGADADTRTFYTMLYHALLFPSVFSDANGQYMGFDGQVHTAQGYTQYANYSGWDIYRSETPLLALLAPQQAADMAQSLLADAQQGGQLPKWSVANGNTDVMVGDPADPIIASTYAFGATGFDTQGALQAMVKGATQPDLNPADSYVERPGLVDYLQLGYVPMEEEKGTAASVLNPQFVWGVAATTLEYTTADFSIAALAQALGDTTTCTTFLQRSANWQTLFNPASGYVEPRSASGAFDPTFSPTDNTYFAEGDGAQYTWMVPYNLAGLFTALGGTAQAADRLHSFFFDPNGAPEFNQGPTSPYAFLGNEPTLETPWEFDWLGQPYQAQDIVRRAMLGLYNASPGGYPGNDDLGEMSSWYIFGALGFYPEIPGVPVLALGSPLFPQITLHLAGGDVAITAPQASDTTPYVQSLTLNGQPYDKPWLPFSALANGAALSYTLGSSPNTSWGSNLDDAPPSFAPQPGASSCLQTSAPAPASPTAAPTTTQPTATPVPPSATLLPPSATPAPPSATLVPPTATSVPPTSTPVPPSATAAPPKATTTGAPPTTTAGGAPTTTGAAPTSTSGNSVLPAATATPRPSSRAGQTGPSTSPSRRQACRGTGLHLTFSAPRLVTSGMTLTVRLRSAARIQVAVTVQMSRTVVVRHTSRNKKHPHAVRTIVVYRVVRRGRTTARGRFVAHLRVISPLSRTAPALLTVTAHRACSHATRYVTLTVRPAAHHRQHVSGKKRVAPHSKQR